MSRPTLQARMDARLKKEADHDERLERLLLEGLASASSPLEDNWLAGMKQKLTAVMGAGSAALP